MVTAPQTAHGCIVASPVLVDIDRRPAAPPGRCPRPATVAEVRHAL